MYHITQKDKKEILKILFKHKCKCKMSVLVKEYSYANDKQSKRAKIREVIKRLNKELQKMLKVEIVENGAWVEIIFKGKENM